MASALSLATRGLGYPGSETAYRTAEGIYATEPESTVLVALLNYPVLVRITKTALEKMQWESRGGDGYHAIGIDAVTKERSIVPLFLLNNTFFSRMDERRSSDKPEHTFEGGTFFYNPQERSFAEWERETYHPAERSFMEKSKLPMVREVKEFQARLFTEFPASCETHAFAIQYVEHFPELLLLSIDVDREWNWNLALQQKRGAPLSSQARDALLQEKMRAVSAKTVNCSLRCPMSGRIVRDPVRLRGRVAVCYEREELNQWARLRAKEPLPRLKTEFDKLVKRAGKFALKLEKQEEGAPFSAALQEESIQLERLGLNSRLICPSETPGDLLGKERAEWLVRTIQHLHKCCDKNEPIFVTEEEAAQAEPDTFARGWAKAFRATHTIY